MPTCRSLGVRPSPYLSTVSTVSTQQQSTECSIPKDTTITACCFKSGQTKMFGYDILLARPGSSATQLPRTRITETDFVKLCRAALLIRRSLRRGVRTQMMVGLSKTAFAAFAAHQFPALWAMRQLHSVLQARHSNARCAQEPSLLRRLCSVVVHATGIFVAIVLSKVLRERNEHDGCNAPHAKRTWSGSGTTTRHPNKTHVLRYYIFRLLVCVLHVNYTIVNLAAQSVCYFTAKLLWRH